MYGINMNSRYKNRVIKGEKGERKSDKRLMWKKENQGGKYCKRKQEVIGKKKKTPVVFEVTMPGLFFRE